MGSKLPVIALTTGEPAGVGPDLSLMLEHAEFAARMVLIGDRDLLAGRLRTLGLTRSLRPYDAQGLPSPNSIEVDHVPLARAAKAGQLDPANGPYVLATLDRAIDGCMNGEFDAMVTAPVHKGAINDAGIPFTGHTEYLADSTSTPRVVMMLVGGGLRVALATT